MRRDDRKVAKTRFRPTARWAITTPDASTRSAVSTRAPIAGVLAAASIEGLAGLAAANPKRWGPDEPVLAAVGAGTAVSLTGYLAWTARGSGRDRA